MITLEIEDIKKLIPHRYPFLYVDRVIELTENSISAIKSISINEHFFQGHFPNEPIMPGVLILEALAQTAGIKVIYYLHEMQKKKNPDNVELKPSMYLLGMEKVKFRKKVVPGDQLKLVVHSKPSTSSRQFFDCIAYVKEDVVCQASMRAMSSSH